MAMARRILAVSSPGGHWVQLQSMREAFRGLEVSWVCPAAQRAVPAGERHFKVSDASKRTPWRIPALVLRFIWIFLRVRPHVVISTGAAPGAFAILLGRCFGARTIWVDSVACAERTSLSGRIAGPCAHLWLTQWEHLAQSKGPRFAGSLL